MDNKRGGTRRPVGEFIERIARRRSAKSGRMRILLDCLTVLVGFLFGRCHLLFSAYPIGIAFVASLPQAVWLGALGATVGSLTLGPSGVPFALGCALCATLRSVICAEDKKCVRFGESVLLRLCSAMISGFVLAAYEIMLRGMSVESVLFGLTMTLAPALLTPIFAGAFSSGISARELILGGGEVMIFSRARGRFNLIVFKTAAVSFIFFISRSVADLRFFGVDISLVIAAALSVLIAKRFGALYGAVVGFVASVGIVPLYSVAFTLLGALAGALLPFGAAVALFLSVCGSSLFCVYAGGLSGLLSYLPECLVGVVLAFPIIGRLSGARGAEGVDARRLAADMVGTMAMSYRLNAGSRLRPIYEGLDGLSSLGGKHLGGKMTLGSSELSLVCAMIRDAEASSLAMREIDEALTDKLEGVFSSLGHKDFVVRAFGGRQRYILAALEDATGREITSPTLLTRISEAAGAEFSLPKYYRRQDMALMELQSRPKYRAEWVTRSDAGGDEVSGDTIGVTECESGNLFAVLSDGMGSGDEARRVSEFTASALLSLLPCGADAARLTYLVNSVLLGTGDECPATLDLFCFDLIMGEARFIKAGAVCSYIKRGESLFRIKSETMPLGVLSAPEAESVSAEIRDGDIVVIMSDGVTGACEDAPWLIEALRADAASLDAYASAIIDGAKRAGTRDDASVVAVRISSV